MTWWRFIKSIKGDFFFPDSAYYYQGYEGTKVGYEQGDRVNDETPHCGRQSLTNPNAIYVAGLTEKPDGQKGAEFDLQVNSRVSLTVVKWLLHVASIIMTSQLQIRHNPWVDIFHATIHAFLLKTTKTKALYCGSLSIKKIQQIWSVKLKCHSF